MASKRGAWIGEADDATLQLKLVDVILSCLLQNPGILDAMCAVMTDSSLLAETSDCHHVVAGIRYV